MPNFKPLTQFYRRLNRKVFMPVSAWFERPAHQWATVGGLGALAMASQSIRESRQRAAEQYSYTPYMNAFDYYSPKIGSVAQTKEPTVGIPRTPPPPSPVTMAKKTQKEIKDTIPKPGEMGTKETTGDILKTSMLDEGIAPLAWGAGGGVLGYIGAKSIVNPLLQAKERQIIHHIEQGQKAVDGLRTLQKVAPFATSALGALLLAALASKISREKTQQEMQWMAQRYGSAANAYQYGTNPRDIMPINDPRGQRSRFY